MTTGSKLSPHVLIPNSGSPLLIKAGCKVVKSVDNMGVLLEAESLNPGVLCIGRFDNPRVTAEWLREQHPNSPQEAARAWVRIYDNLFHLNPHVDIVESPNEPVFNHDDGTNEIAGFRWLNDFLVELTLILASKQMRLVGPNFSTGYPAMDTWKVLLPFLYTLKAHNGILSIHGYSVVPPAEDNDNTNRHEAIYSQVLVPSGLSDLPIVYTEWGELSYKEEIRDLHGALVRPALSDEEYAARLIGGDERLRRFTGRLLGATVFTFGSNNAAWDAYNVGNDGNKVPATLSEHIKNTPEGTPMPPDPIPTPPTKTKAGDRVEVIATDSQGRPVVALNARKAPGLDAQIQRTMKAGDKALVVGNPVIKDDIEWPALVYDNRPIEYSSAGYLKVISSDVPTPEPPNPIPTPGGNLLVNGNFDDGHYHWHDVPEITIPLGFDFWYALKTDPRLPRQDDDWYPPECVVWNKNQAPEHEQDVFWLSGLYILKVFKGWGPIHWRLFQQVNGLEVGRRYKFTAPVYPDLVMKYDGNGNKVFADDPLAGEVKLSAAGVDTGWRDGHQFPFGQYTTHTLDFTANSNQVEVALECRGRWGLVNNGFFVDSLKLERVE